METNTLQQDNIYDYLGKDLYRLDPNAVLNNYLSATALTNDPVADNSVTVPPDTIGSGVSTSIETQSVGNIAAGKTKFDNTEVGYILGIDKGVTKFYIGNITNYLNWDGTQLIISGNITATSGTIGGWTIGATTISSANITLDSGNNKITIGSSNGIIIDGANHKITSSDGTAWILNGDGTVSGFTSSPTNGVFQITGGANPQTKTVTHGYGTTPKRITIYAIGGLGAGATAATENLGFSNGHWDASGQSCVYGTGASPSASGMSTTKAVYLHDSDSGANVLEGTVGNVTSTTFDIVFSPATFAGGTSNFFSWSAS